jgi:hypothetical protein
VHRFSVVVSAGALLALQACDDSHRERSAAGAQPAASAGEARAGRRAAGEHVLLTIELSPHGARTIDARRVRSPLPRSARARGASLRVEVVDEGEAVLFAAEVRRPALYGEFARSDGSYERAQVAADTSVVAVRVPALAGGSRVRVSAPAPEGARVSATPGPRAGGRVVLGSVPYPRELP